MYRKELNYRYYIMSIRYINVREKSIFSVDIRLNAEIDYVSGVRVRLRATMLHIHLREKAVRMQSRDVVVKTTTQTSLLRKNQ